MSYNSPHSHPLLGYTMFSCRCTQSVDVEIRRMDAEERQKEGGKHDSRSQWLERALLAMESGSLPGGGKCMSVRRLPLEKN